MDDGIEVRGFTMDDYDEVMSLWERCDAERKPKGRDAREAVERQLGLGTAIYLVAEDGGRIVGTVFATHDGRRGWINRLVVDQDRRRRGIGTMLVREAERRLDAAGIDITAVHVWEWNAASIATFGSLGYERAPECIYMSRRKGPDV
ncbi:MAG: GNAT family N-acetyltransferase [Thermoplasmata archaeon]|nr:GNAT family N-acetyltransferase [Thermoplasmata archaeon]